MSLRNNDIAMFGQLSYVNGSNETRGNRLHAKQFKLLCTRVAINY